jgi:excisionase family DNA binding protein
MATAVVVTPQKTIIEQLEERTTVLSVNEVAKLIGEHKFTLYRRINRKEIPHLKLGHSVKFDPHELSRWLKANHKG